MSRAKRKPLSVWDRLARAYDQSRGLRLSADDVDTLILMDTAVQDAAFDHASETGGTFELRRGEKPDVVWPPPGGPEFGVLQ